ncbi:MAG: insulinase family protein [Bacteroidetes bacterium]|nr:insulinase family protein [Bacteroidota bacterium]
MKFETYILPNGIKIIHQQNPSQVAHCGIIINAGSRDELQNQHGIAHFIEHSVFKGTNKRKAYHVISRLEDIGAEIDAFTTKENICVYASFLQNYYERTIELLSDIIFNSTFPDKEINNEKEVIIEEINSYQDNPAELIFDDFEKQIFNGHPLSRDILGNPKLLKEFTKVDIQNFIEKNFNTDQIVLCSVGNINFSKFIKLAEKYFSKLPINLRTVKRLQFNNYKASEQIVEKKTHQTHCIVGNIAYNMRDNKKMSLELLNDLLAGSGLSSRLNMALREKKGLVYTVESFFAPYIDTGIAGIYFGTYNGNLNKSLSIIKKELFKLRNNKLGIMQLHRAKLKLIGSVAIASESKSSLMLAAAKGFLQLNKVKTINDIIEEIQNITAEQILTTANEIYDFDNMSSLIFE